MSCNEYYTIVGGTALGGTPQETPSFMLGKIPFCAGKDKIRRYSMRAYKYLKELKIVDNAKQSEVHNNSITRSNGLRFQERR